MPAFSMRVKHKPDNMLNVPGPGTYDGSMTPVKKRGETYGFGSASQRQKMPPPASPGPGNYHIPCSITQMPGYTAARSKDFAYI